MTAATAIVLGLVGAFALAAFCLGFAYPSGRFITLCSEIPEAEWVRYQLFQPSPVVSRQWFRCSMLLVYLGTRWLNTQQAKRVLPPALQHALLMTEIWVVPVGVIAFLLMGVVWSSRVMRGVAGERGPQMQKVARWVFTLSVLGFAAWAYLLREAL